MASVTHACFTYFFTQYQPSPSYIVLAIKKTNNASIAVARHLDMEEFPDYDNFMDDEHVAYKISKQAWLKKCKLGEHSDKPSSASLKLKRNSSAEHTKNTLPSHVEEDRVSDKKRLSENLDIDSASKENQAMLVSSSQSLYFGFISTIAVLASVGGLAIFLKPKNKNQKKNKHTI